MKKTLHVISHSHWDREWYMPFEHHRYRLVELIDDVIFLCENDPGFKYFHLDGQVLPIYDYLEIKPENRERLLKLVKNNQIQIGPWYILQDAFLTSAEANVRNMLLGLKHSKQLGADPVRIGYFPDTFGNISQGPQICKKFGIDVAAFGRGLNEVGFDNQIVKQDGLNKSEMIWASPDGSEVVGLLFTNWYCNANDLPSDDDEVKERIGRIIKNAEKFSTNNDLLALNGCDHTPVQKDISTIISKAQKFFPDYEIIHSNFKDYISKVVNKTNNLNKFTGEIIGQLTTGYNLLNNTASTRVDVKQINYLAQMTLEREVEPISSIGFLFGLPYDSNYIERSWIKLIENHTHDAICTCSVDPVNDLVLTRLSEAFYSAEITRNEAVRRIVEDLSIKVDDETKEVVVFNKFAKTVNQNAKVVVNFPLHMQVKSVKVVDNKGNELPSTFTYKHNVFTYRLPKNSFRKVTYTDQFEIEFFAKNIPGLGYQTYRVIPVLDIKENTVLKSRIIENKHTKIKFNNDGSFTYTNKLFKITKENLGIFEYQANCGNEYNFEQSHDKRIILSKGLKAQFQGVTKNELYQEIKYVIKMSVPAGISNKLTTKEVVDTTITTKVRLYHNEKSPRFHVTFDNQADNARYRILFDANIKTDYALSEGQFDLVKRPLAVWEGWKNPVKTNRYYNFVSLESKDESILVSGIGLHEYEVLDNNKELALTLLSGVDQMGDWGYFPTPNSQMKGINSVDFIFLVYNDSQKHESYEEAYQFQYGRLVTSENNLGYKLKNSSFKLIEYNNDNIILSALKKAENDDNLILRLYSISSNNETVTINLNNLFKKVELVNLNEDFEQSIDLKNNKFELKFKPKEILTVKLYKGVK